MTSLKQDCNEQQNYTEIGVDEIMAKLDKASVFSISHNHDGFSSTNYYDDMSYFPPGEFPNGDDEDCTQELTIFLGDMKNREARCSVYLNANLKHRLLKEYCCCPICEFIQINLESIEPIELILEILCTECTEDFNAAKNS